MSTESPPSSYFTAMDSDYGIQSILSDDEQDAWDEVDAPFLERPSSSALVMPTISANGSVVSSREIMSNGDGFLNGDFPVPTFAHSWTTERCLCRVPSCGCDRLRSKVEEYFKRTTKGEMFRYVVVFEDDSEAAKLAKATVLKRRMLGESVAMFMDTQFELSEEIRRMNMTGVEVAVLDEMKDAEEIEENVEKTKPISKSTLSYAKILLSIGVVLFVLFNPQKDSSFTSSSPASNVTFSGPPQPVSPYIYQIPESMIFASCHHLDKPEVHVPAHHHGLDTDVVFHLLSEGFQRLWNGLKNLPVLLSRLLGLDNEVFETNSERTLRKIELDMDLLVELLDEILEEQTVETLHDALYIWNKMGSDIAEPLRRLKYDEKTSSANFLAIIKLEKRLKAVGEKLAAAKMALRAESRGKISNAREKRDVNKSRETVLPRQKALPSLHPADYLGRMQDRDEQSHERRGWRREMRKDRRAKRRARK